MRVPNPGTVAERHIMAASQPGFLEAARDGVLAARNASCVDGAGNSSHTAVISWTRFTVLGLGISSRRPLDPIASSLDQKLCEVDVVEAWAWWLVQHVGGEVLCPPVLLLGPC